MDIQWTELAAKQLRRVPTTMKQRIAAKMRFFATQPDPLVFAKSMVGQKQRYRFRIGVYRVIVQRTGARLWVMQLGKRDSVYDR